MKKFLLAFFAISFFATTSIAQQRIVYVDTQYILENMPEYEEAQSKLQEFSKVWSEEIAEKEKSLINQKASFKENELLLPDVKKIEQQKLIEDAEDELVKMKMKRFGTKGDLYKKQQDLIQPIQDKIYNAIKQMAEYRDYDIVLDKSTGVSILFVKSKLDVSDEVLRIINSKN